MPTYFTAEDVLNMRLPGVVERKGFVNSPRSETFGDVLIPEEKFNKNFTIAAQQLQYQAKRMGERDKKIRGVNTKPETYATLQLVEAGKLEAEPKYTFEEFLLQQVQEAAQEKYQLVETFGETVGFFFGARPKVYSYSGTLMNTEDYPWRDNWKRFYETKLRGTKLVEQKRRAYLTYDYVLREGYILSMSMSDMSAKNNSVDFSFVMFITKETNLAPEDLSNEVTLKEIPQILNPSTQEMAAKADSMSQQTKDNLRATFDLYNSVGEEDLNATDVGMNNGRDGADPHRFEQRANDAAIVAAASVS